MTDRPDPTQTEQDAQEHDDVVREYDAEAADQEEYDALHRVYLIARQMTLYGKVPGNDAESLLGDLESAVLAAQDALPYERKGET